jgi:hypothetical protein
VPGSYRSTTRNRPRAARVRDPLDRRRGVEQVCDPYLDKGLIFAEFTGTRYLRINRVRELQQAGRLDHTLRWRVRVEEG